MARKNVLGYKVASAQSLSTSFNSNPTLINYLDNISYQINVMTTDSSGTFAVQVSDDYKVDETTGLVVNAGNWSALDLSGTPFAAGANDTIGIALNQVPYGAVRIAYTSTIPGTGTADIYMFDKQVGG